MGSRFSDNVLRVSRIANLSSELAIPCADSIVSDVGHYLDIRAAQHRVADIHLLR
ncbi:MAG: hypothetical protein WBM61_16860 [Woeseiaceae bacterium]